MKIRNWIRLPLITCVLAITLVSCAKGRISGGFDWPSWRGPKGNGVSQEANWNPKALIGGPKILWRADLGSAYSNVSIDNDRVYAAGSPGMTVYCLSADTGKIIWRYLEKNDTANATPTVDAGSVYMLSKKGILVSLNKKNGSLQWKKDLVADYGGLEPYYGFSGSPVIEKDLIILTMNKSGIVLNKKTGAKIWGSEKPPAEQYPPRSIQNGVEYSTPVLYEEKGQMYAVLYSYEGVHSVEVETGKIRWLYDWQKIYKIQIATDPLVFEQKLFVLQYYGEKGGEALGGVLFDISGAAPRILWMNKELGSNIASPVMVNGYIYLCQEGPQTMRGSLWCLDVQRGKIIWEEPLDKQPISIMGNGDKLIILSERGTLIIAEATSRGYEEISRCDVLRGKKGFRQFYTPPVLCNGRIYCRNSIGDLICIDVSK
jgi:outer membrane protein assembly factor BamB